MSSLKSNLVNAASHAGLIFLLAGGSELVSQAIAHYTNTTANTYVDKTLIMAALGYAQKFISSALTAEEATGL
jgi:hypothetical protein